MGQVAQQCKARRMGRHGSPTISAELVYRDQGASVGPFLEWRRDSESSCGTHPVFLTRCSATLRYPATEHPFHCYRRPKRLGRLSGRSSSSQYAKYRSFSRTRNSLHQCTLPIAPLQFLAHELDDWLAAFDNRHLWTSALVSRHPTV